MTSVLDFKSKYKTLMLLSIVNFLGNILFFITIFLLLFQQNFYKTHPSLVIFFFMSVFVLYYLVIFILIAHYSTTIKTFAEKNSDLFYGLMWLSVFIVGFIIFYYSINQTVALEIFGGGVVMFILNKAIKSLRGWRNKKNFSTTGQPNQPQPPVISKSKTNPRKLSRNHPRS